MQTTFTLTLPPAPQPGADGWYAPQIELLPDGRHVAVLQTIQQVHMLKLAPAMKLLLMRVLAVAAHFPEPEIQEVLRDIADVLQPHVWAAERNCVGSQR